MSGLPISDPISLGKAVKDFLSYWKNFKNKKIRIIGPISSSIKYNDTGIEYHTFTEIIEGKVGAVLAYPPGILLEDIEQFVRHEWNKPYYGLGRTEPVKWSYNSNDSTERKSLDQIFISFNFINVVEFP